MVGVAGQRRASRRSAVDLGPSRAPWLRPGQVKRCRLCREMACDEIRGGGSVEVGVLPETGAMTELVRAGNRHSHTGDPRGTGAPMQLHHDYRSRLLAEVPRGWRSATPWQGCAAGAKRSSSAPRSVTRIRPYRLPRRASATSPSHGPRAPGPGPWRCRAPRRRPGGTGLLSR